MTETELALDENSPATYVVPQRRLFNIKAIVFAAFFGGVLAAGTILAINYYRLGMRRSAIAALVVSFSIMLGLCVLEYKAEMMPIEKIMILNLFILAVIYAVASQLQGEMIRMHVAQGGDVFRVWWANGIGILCFFVNLLILAVVLVLMNQWLPTSN
ncbi:hypothetical protein [Planctomicrobium piriforme]|uniref:Uncharacterized protein n=1 Tax=Planctomicrobium piriforme TaxID=1576369 RepID=A0A1I3C2G4_9PLAN|nr:hypothetical protein [Planctomicrobium piriforme]SFH68798.1 hypothetical protein SAMN05421753_10265 [Planctomicrobium piriforme]